MQVFEMVAIIVVAVTIGGVVKAYIENRNKTPETSETDGRLAKLDELEQRVQTLEKIVTDKKYELHQKFRDLQD